MARTGRYSQEVRERAVRMVFEHGSEYDSEWEAICSIAEKIGCSSETLRKWVRRMEVDTGRREGLTSDERARIKELERENRELRRANEILRKASAYFAQAELDRRPK
jgi:transposase-like protein